MKNTCPFCKKRSTAEDASVCSVCSDEIMRNLEEGNKEYAIFQKDLVKRKAADAERMRKRAEGLRMDFRKKDVTPRPEHSSIKPEVDMKQKPKAAVKAPPKPAQRVRPGAATKAETLVLREGTTSVAAGDRRLLLEHLKAMGGKASFTDMSEKMGKPVAPYSKSIRPALSSLVKAGWVEVKNG